MTNEQLAHYREKLEAMRAELSAGLENTLDTLNSRPGNIPDPNDRASMESDLGFELRIRARERKLADKIDAALQRIKTGNYGICRECGREISKERLEARPVSELCIDCKTKQERREKEQGR